MIRCVSEYRIDCRRQTSKWMENVVELIPAIGENHHGHVLRSEEHSDVALNDLATGPEVLQEHGLNGPPGPMT